MGHQGASASSKVRLQKGTGTMKSPLLSSLYLLPWLHWAVCRGRPQTSLSQ